MSGLGRCLCTGGQHDLGPAVPCFSESPGWDGARRNGHAAPPHCATFQRAVSRARCLLAAGSAGKGRAHKENTEVPRFHFSHKRLLFCSYVVRREKSLRRASFLSCLLFAGANPRCDGYSRARGGGLVGAVPCPVPQPPQCPDTNTTSASPGAATSDKNAVGTHFQQQKALCW